MATAGAKWWSKDTVAVVTGGNKGIGLAIVKGLAGNGITTVLTARDTGRGTEAAESLKAEGLDSAVFHPLDVTNADSADNLVTWLKKEYGGVDILINNAGIAEWEVTYAAAKNVLDTNYYAVKQLTEKMLPLLRPGARIVNLSSSLGQLSGLGSASLVEKLSDVEHLTEQDVDSFATKYLEAVKAGRVKEEGWCEQYTMYSESKILLNAYTRVFAKTLAGRPENKKVYVNVVHPGYIGTDLNNHSVPGTVEEGADTAVWLALLREEKYPNGQFFFTRKPLDF